MAGRESGVPVRTRGNQWRDDFLLFARAGARCAYAARLDRPALPSATGKPGRPVPVTDRARYARGGLMSAAWRWPRPSRLSFAVLRRNFLVWRKTAATTVLGDVLNPMVVLL